MENTATLTGLLAPVNELLTPAIRLGVANPLPLTSGFVLLEVAGRKSGKIRTVPLLCTDYGSVLFVSTVRSNSQWVKNLASGGEANVWLRGRRRKVIAEVYQQGRRLSSDPAAPASKFWTTAARSFSQATGTSVAVLFPAD
jgi:deazaflavin-dependent oxidoreductase (nitroreductase family)